MFLLKFLFEYPLEPPFELLFEISTWSSGFLARYRDEDRSMRSMRLHKLCRLCKMQVIAERTESPKNNSNFDTNLLVLILVCFEVFRGFNCFRKDAIKVA